jgi:hypothetical protein
MITYRANGSVLLQDDTDRTRQQVIPAAATKNQQDAVILTFFGAPTTPLLDELGRIAQIEARLAAKGI